MLGVLIGVGGAIILVSITLFAIMCFRVKYEKFSRTLFSRTRGNIGNNGGSVAVGDLDNPDDLYVDLTDTSPDLIPSDGEFFWQIISAEIWIFSVPLTVIIVSNMK